MQPAKQMAAPMPNKPPWYQGQQAPPQYMYSGTNGRLIPNPMARSMNPSAAQQDEAVVSGNADETADVDAHADMVDEPESYEMGGTGAADRGEEAGDGYYGFQ
ncbi:uncharacterized protein DSM5745_01003 [Aspergillus mulundensis]|uniref:Uncharacterized protein n=1 Tax=Aspergillus mulundensis TaxID=1810919 RepID=A0A3D8T5H0_9EURO|nr:hypothetical protein DSM5745_01003 [Aspergillus mulundensis]RDW93681.1 hypothetical protein DSM5745_01003 [Aspergillus mulundensis]